MKKRPRLAQFLKNLLKYFRRGHEQTYSTLNSLNIGNAFNGGTDSTNFVKKQFGRLRYLFTSVHNNERAGFETEKKQI